MDNKFNPAPPSVMHVDINSCFATIEQQANPLLYGKPLAVAAYTQENGCILAASREAKRIGIETGMRVRDGRRLCPGLIILPPDPDKYRFVNRQLFSLLCHYSSDVSIESIDEMVLKLPLYTLDAMRETGKEIKRRIAKDIGERITVSVGIAPNRYLAKVASGFHKPDGLDSITGETIESTLERMELEDLCGIKTGNANRLRMAGIVNPLAMYKTDSDGLERAFHSVFGRYWWLRLHGYEDGSLYKSFGTSCDPQKSFGQSYAMGKPYGPDEHGLYQILTQLTMKMCRRMRRDGFTAQGTGVSLFFSDYSHWHTRQTYKTPLYADCDIYRRLEGMIAGAPRRQVRILAIYVFHLQQDLYRQQKLLENDRKKEHVTKALDAISDRWGDFTVMTGRMLHADQKVLDRIAFGKVKV